LWHEFGHLVIRGFNAHIASTKDGGRRMTRKRQREEVQIDIPPQVAPTTGNKKIVSEAGYAMEEAVFGGRLSHISEQHLWNIESVITHKEGKKQVSHELDQKYLSCQKATVASCLPDFKSLQKIKGQRRETIYKDANATNDVVVRKLLIFEGYGNTTESGRKSAPIVIW
jgi:hypothetical protein